MRLPLVERGEKLRHRLLFRVIRLASGHRAPDVVRTLKFREEFFGGKMMFQAVMRGPSPWSIGERELFAAYVSKVNACEF
ncbi:MAG: peroxidase [Kofleriaceae bacterium]